MTQKRNREILEYLYDWRKDETGPGGPAPIVFPDTLYEIPSLDPSRDGDPDMCWRLLHDSLTELSERGFVTWPLERENEDCCEISVAGIDKLLELRSGDLLPSMVRYSKAGLSLILKSVILPIVVTICTVWALHKLGYAP